MSSKTARRVTVVLVCASLICALSLGVRHTFGLFMRPMTLDLQWGREAFSIAIARGRLDADQLRSFACDNPIRLHSRMNAEFFTGTPLAAYARELIGASPTPEVTK